MVRKKVARPLVVIEGGRAQVRAGLWEVVCLLADSKYSHKGVDMYTISCAMQIGCGFGCG